MAMEIILIQSNDNKILCAWCGQPSAIIWVYGHGQCSNCGYNVDECCRGELNQNTSLQENNSEETS